MQPNYVPPHAFGPQLMNSFLFCPVLNTFFFFNRVLTYKIVSLEYKYTKITDTKMLDDLRRKVSLGEVEANLLLIFICAATQQAAVELALFWLLATSNLTLTWITSGMATQNDSHSLRTSSLWADGQASQQCMGLARAMPSLLTSKQKCVLPPDECTCTLP